MKLLVINGPNLNLLGLREPGIYGKGTLSDLEDFLRKVGEEEGVELSFFQSNHEGAIVDTIQAAYGVMDGIVINPAAYTHTSIAILDALKAVSLPAVEVHISQVSDRRLRHPSEAVRVGDVVKVKVLEVDEKRKRISLSMRQAKE